MIAKYKIKSQPGAVMEQIIDTSNHTYRTELPNIIFDIGLDPYEFMFYSYLKRIAGDSGAAWKSNSTMAKETGICKRKIPDLKKSLSQKREELGNIPLIYIEKRKKEKKDCRS